MIPVLNKIGTHCAVFGNHDFGKFEWFNLKIFAFAIICSGPMKGILKSSSKLGLKIKEDHLGHMGVIMPSDATVTVKKAIL